MTAIERVRSTRLALGAGAMAQAIAWGVAAALGVLAALSFTALAFPALDRDAELHRTIALAAAIATAAVLVWRSRHLTSVGRVALWIEEKIPDLHYSLVTAIEDDRTPHPKSSARRDEVTEKYAFEKGETRSSIYRQGIEAAVARQDISRVTRGAIGRTVLPALSAAVLAAALLYISPSRAFGGGATFSRIAGSLSGSSVPAGSRLENLSVQVIPPAYTSERATALQDPASVAALVGSRILVRGGGAASGLTGTLGTASLDLADSRGGWTTSVIMPAKPAALTLRDRGFERILVLEPRADNPPRIALTSPERDSTLRVAQLMLRLAATATDDIGLDGGYFEYLITTGSGEVFSARTVTTPAVHFGGSRSGSIAATLDLASLRLGEGDVVSIRAIAQDGNTPSGPGLATSDTRTIRIARAGEYDSMAIDAAAPLPLDSSAMSQRMLIAMTENLVRQQQRLTRQELVKRSTEIGDMEDRIRKRVHEVLFEAEDRVGQEQPGELLPGIEEMEPPDDVTESKNPDLSAAYNALWQAVRSLQIAEPEPALPSMRVALKALDRVRLANRLYLRGMPPKVIVDLARVRMTGKEKGSASTRTPRTAADSARVNLERRFSDAIELIESKPAGAIRAFTLLQVDALSTSPSFASAVGEAIEAFRKGRDATLPLLRARRVLSGDPVGTPGLPSWAGGW